MLDQYEIYKKVIFETLGSWAQLKSAVLIAAGNQNQGVKLATTEGTFFLKLNFDHERDIFAKKQPALLHGDLWSGNVICDQEGKPCLIDPAVYFGHREMDLAFSKLFGGFDSRFYEAYESIIPLEPDFESRIGIYNLYPLLVHLNLFGVAYLPGIEKIIKQFQ
jgi:fructosamine-3-kinase